MSVMTKTKNGMVIYSHTAETVENVGMNTGQRDENDISK